MLITMNVGGNLHEAAEALKRKWYVQFLFHMHYSGGNTIVVLKFQSREDYERLWKELGYRKEGM